MTSINLHKLNPQTIRNDEVVLFVGRRGSGKTFLMEDICYFKRYVDEVIVYSATEDGNHTWGKHVPGLFIFTKYNGAHLEGVYKHARRATKRHDRDPRSCPPKSIMIIVEDQTYDRSIMRDKILREVMMNGRHYNILVFITMQYARDMGPDIRSQIGHVFCMQEKIVENREKLYKGWGGMFPTFDSFNQVMMQCTENYGALVLDHIAKTSRVEECVFWYKAQNRGPYKIGKRALWVYHYLHYKDDENSDGTDSQEDEDAACRFRPQTKRQPKIQVFRKQTKKT